MWGHYRQLSCILYYSGQRAFLCLWHIFSVLWQQSDESNPGNLMSLARRETNLPIHWLVIRVYLNVIIAMLKCPRWQIFYMICHEIMFCVAYLVIRKLIHVASCLLLCVNNNAKSGLSVDSTRHINHYVSSVLYHMFYMDCSIFQRHVRRENLAQPVALQLQASRSFWASRPECDHSSQSIFCPGTDPDGPGWEKQDTDHEHVD